MFEKEKKKYFLNIKLLFFQAGELRNVLLRYVSLRYVKKSLPEKNTFLTKIEVSLRKKSPFLKNTFF
jgi:hypothetical protein